jgi:esterase/lipase
MLEELSNLSIKSFYQIDIPVVFIQGQHDNQVTKNRIQVLYQNWRCNDKEIIEIKGAQHNIHEDVYLECIKNIIKEHSV